MRSKGIRGRLLVGFFVIAGFVPLVGGLAVASGWVAARDLGKFQRHELQTIHALRDASEAALRIEIASAVIAHVQGRGEDEGQAELMARVGDLQAGLRQLERAVQVYETLEDEDEAERVERVRSSAVALASATQRMPRLVEGGSETLDAVRAAERNFRKVLEEVSAEERAELEEAGSGIQDLLSTGLLINAAATLLSCAAAVLIAGRVSRSITRPVAALGRAAEEIGQGRLDCAIDVDSRDELGLLGERMREMARNLARSQQERDESRREAECANRAKSEFLANMSHEIRTPMTAILGYAEILQTDAQGGEEQRDEVLRVIRRNGEHLLRVINDILDLSRIEAGRLTMARERCSVCQVVAEVAAMMRVRAASKGIRLDVEYVFPVPATIESDALRLKQILANLVGNAVKFTESGEVRVRVRSDAVAQGIPRIAFEVIDTGVGIDPAQVERLFKPFSQVDGSMTRRFGGSGLGLLISRRLAQMLDGDITVASEPGRGSVFTLTIGSGALEGVKMIHDAKEALIPDAEPSAAAEAPALRGRILLAEDGPDNQRLIAMVLRKAGAEVVVAENGLIAIETLETAERQGNPIDIVLMDMQMPELDGYEATRRLRRNSVDLPIIALTAHAMTGDREKCLAAGCSDYAAKPIDRRALVNVCAQWLAHGGVARAAA